MMDADSLDSEAGEKIHLAFMIPADETRPEHHFEFVGHDLVGEQDVNWVSEFADSIRLANSSDAFQMFDESWLQISGLLETLSELPPAKPSGPFAWDHEKQVRRFFFLVANYLSSGRTYIESTDTLLVRQFGKDSELARDFKSDLSDAFDNVPGYAICYHLRNILVHTGSLPGSLSFSTIDDSDLVKVEYTIAKSEMLAIRDWNKSVRSVIVGLPDVIDFLELIRANFQAIVRIERRRARRQMELLMNEIPRFRSICAAARMPEGAIPMVASIESPGGGVHHVAHRVIPHESALADLELAHSEGDVLRAARILVNDATEDSSEGGGLGDAALERRLMMSRRLALTYSVHGPEALSSAVAEIVRHGPRNSAAAISGMVEQCAVLAGMINQISGISHSRIFGYPEK
ncbi:hypothetical protein MHY29_00650 [Micrococcus sp. ACRRV]|uniref:hypothetical protein n=1 Tax=Micrococcus sp. ACRRV TaxID=2918203 RepID=UPI001EF1FFDC|nr:hypothetical protein [Micrococcus sp. ACRRV]MCG7421366.1 hypothetical protein [Micrococcus sp. ACRRV]